MPAPRHRSRMSCRNASEIMCGLFSALGEGRTPSQTAPVHGRGIRSPCAQTESPKEAADCFCDFAGLLHGKKVVCLFNDEEPGIGDAFRDDLQFCRWRSGIFSPGDREGRNNNPRQKLGDVGSFEHRANTLKDILCVWKVDDPVAIAPNQLRLRIAKWLGQKRTVTLDRRSWPVDQRETLAKAARFDRATAAVRVVRWSQSARVPRRPRDVCKQCASRASRQLNGRPKPAWTDRAGREGHNSRRPSPQA